MTDFPFVVLDHDDFEGPHFNDLWTFAIGADEADLQDEKGWVFYGCRTRGGINTGT